VRGGKGPFSQWCLRARRPVANRTPRHVAPLFRVRWSKMRLSPGRERGLFGNLVQNASESTRIRLDPAKTARLRRILDQSAAVTPGRGETQTHFGPSPLPGGVG